jgi:ATP-binding cassette subfamily F protein uup
MTPYIQAENLSKRFGNLLLFENISFTVFEGQKVALIAKNGTGKTTLITLLAGIDSPDSGKITLKNGVRIGYFEQSPELNPEHSALNEIFASSNEKLNAIKEFELAMARNNQEDVTKYSALIDSLGAWEIEVKIRQILSKLKITELDQPVKTMSGGQQKRLALAKVLIGEPDLMILDEPTNHLDLEMIEWLEQYLAKSKATLLMVTHDRYFLDRVCNEIIEMDNNQIYRYKGNYSYFIEKREERLQAQEASVLKAKNLLRTEIEWMRRMPQARGHKAKYRIDAFYELKDKASLKRNDSQVELTINSARLGNKIAEIENLSKSYNQRTLISDFSYKFSRYEKVGLIGDNGTGKTTFLNLLTQIIEPDSGKVDIGQTIRFGYYRQEGIQFNPGDRVIDAVTKIAEYIYFEDGRKVSPSQLLTQFLFLPETQYSLIETLSGGEKRRLYLCTVLMQNPNFLILDEPTNDLDIMTLQVLEDYLAGFGGCVVVVSHDRFFMDKIVDHLFVFDGNGKITDFPGNYTIYRNWLEEKQEAAAEIKPKTIQKEKPKSNDSAKRKMTFNEKREFEKLAQEISGIEEEVRKIDTELNSGNLSHEELFKKSNRIASLKGLLDEKEFRWLELSELE